MKRLWIGLLVLGLLLSIIGVSLPDQATSSKQKGVSIYLTDVEQDSDQTNVEQAAGPKAECPASNVTVMDTHTPETGIPEFPTIALPIAGILVLFLFFSHRKRQ